MPDGAHLYTTMTIEHPDYPVDGGAVRMRLFKKTKAWQDGDDVCFIDLANVNTGGYVPAYQTNMVVGSLIGKGLDSMQEKLQKFV